MKYRTRTYYTDSQKALMWDRWKQGWTLHQIAQLFNRAHTSVQGILARSGGIRPPQRRRCPVTLTLTDGSVLRSVPTTATGDPENPLSDREVRQKFGRLCADLLPLQDVVALEDAVDALADAGEPAARLLGLLRRPVAIG